jgi:hypothetical protein
MGHHVLRRWLGQDYNRSRIETALIAYVGKFDDLDIGEQIMRDFSYNHS